jgi:magnesium chelatase subunit D
LTPVFPFTAIVGQEALGEALLACAVDPRIGGVLVRGERGTAKSTAVRALAPLLGDVEVVAGCRFNADPSEAAACPDGPHDGAEVVRRPVALVELPVGATADRLLGSLDLDRALRDGVAAFEPGLLAAAHRGILYADEVNLLPDHLVDVLLDAAAMGRAHVEREAVSVSHPARFLLVGTMNPEEGELRPQLLDRFGLSVDVAASPDPAQRVEVVRRRLAFDADPEGLRTRFAADEAALAQRVAAARERLASVVLDDRTLLLIAGICARLGVDGMRADIVCAQAARALAALDGDDAVGEDHVRRAARLALAHRRRRGPLEAPGLDESELEQALDEARGDDPEPEPPGGGGNGTSRNGAPPPARGDQAPDRSAPDPTTASGRDERVANTEAVAPDEPAATPDPAAPGREPRGPRAAADAAPHPHAPAPERVDAPGAAGRAPSLSLTGVGHGAAGRRSRATGAEGQPVDSRQPSGTVSDLAVPASLRAAAARRALSDGPPLARADLREHIRAGREGNLVVFCVDASGSMGARRRMAAVKGAVLGLLLDAYRRRDRVALVTFRGTGAEVVLAPTGSIERAAAVLGALATGGATPLAAGLHRAAELVTLERRRDPERRALVLAVTDGRASGEGGFDAARAAAAELARVADGVVVFDGEEGRVRLGLAAELARAAGAPLLPLAALHRTATAPRRAA